MPPGGQGYLWRFNHGLSRLGRARPCHPAECCPVTHTPWTVACSLWASNWYHALVNDTREPKPELHQHAPDNAWDGIPQGPPSLWSHAVPWLGIFLVAAAVRLIYLKQIQAIPYFDAPVGDAAAYDAWAQQIAAGDWVGKETFYQAPAYPYFLGAIYSIFGRAPFAARAVQAILGSLACMLLALAGRKFFNRQIGLAAGMILALYPPAIFFDGLIQKTSLATFFMAALLLLAASVRDRAKWWHWLLIGLVLGLFGLTRENALVLAPVMAGWVWLGFRACAIPRRLAWTGLLLAGLALTLGPVAVRNYSVGGEFAITTVQAGPNFYIGNHAGATGRYVPLVRGHESPPFERADAERLAEAATGRDLDAGEVSRYWLAQSWDYITAAPLDWLALVGKKLLLVFNEYEITDVEGYNVYKGFSWVLAILGVVLHFGVICPLAAAGMAIAWPERKRVGILFAMVVALAGAVAIFYVMARYRFPLVPVMILFAAVGIVEGLNRLRNQNEGGLIAPALLLIAATVICNLPINPERRLDSMAFANLAGVLAQRGEVQAATNVFRIALEENPDSPELHYNLGLAYLLQRQIGLAIEHLNRAKELDPELIEVDYQLGVAYEVVGERERALHHYQEALRINPNDQEAQAAVARLAEDAPEAQSEPRP